MKTIRTIHLLYDDEAKNWRVEVFINKSNTITIERARAGNLGQCVRKIRDISVAYNATLPEHLDLETEDDE